MRPSRLVTSTVLAVLCLLYLAASAAAEFGPIRLISSIPPEQATEADSPAISADGRFLAFQGTIDEGRQGVFRLDLDSGDLARVSTSDPGEFIPAAARAAGPSISADGRYVSFMTKARLDPVGDTLANNRDVYVADMSTVPPSYELVSAFDESTQSLGGESIVSPRVAISANGRRVAFVHDRQVYLRDLDADSTMLVSVRRDPENGVMEPGVEVPGGAVMAPENLLGAALSADGTTVAWAGAHLPEQVPLLADEHQQIAASDAGAIPYGEPLWRRVADGPLVPTRRVVGGGDPLAPGCPGTAGTLAIPACHGPFLNLANRHPDFNNAVGWLGTASADGVPQLSADGRWVAVLGNPTEAANAFLVDMSPGLSRVQAVRQLTAQVPVFPTDESAVVNRDPYVPLNGHVYDLAISADGGRVAFATARQRFPLTPPILIGSPPARLGLVELYLANLETGSLQRLSHGVAGASEPSLSESPGVTGKDGTGAGAPTIGGDGSLVGFASTAWNLVAGDGNKASDVFLMEDEAQAPGTGTVILPSPRKPRKPRPARKLTLSSFSLPNGKVRVVAVAPTTGKLRASAAAPLEVGSQPRPLDRKKARARANRPVKLVLALPPRLRHLAKTRSGLYATVRIVFRAAGGKKLSAEQQVRFYVHPSKKKRDR